MTSLAEISTQLHEKVELLCKALVIAQKATEQQSANAHALAVMAVSSAISLKGLLSPCLGGVPAIAHDAGLASVREWTEACLPRLSGVFIGMGRPMDSQKIEAQILALDAPAPAEPALAEMPSIPYRGWFDGRPNPK